ncbi:MAG: helix-turn-helix transcriptional regulator [Syntrophomonadaceae bacterium]|nr:helix-turn-helix transcriptional regulator [Syntrophomonadaceae bacterium]
MKSLAEYRKEQNLSQIELSIALKKEFINVSPASIAMYEIGRRTPPLKKAQAIAKFFGVGTDDIFFGINAHIEKAEEKSTSTD